MAELITEKRELFAQAVARGMSNKNAAIAAGYSARTASAAGSRLMKDPEVKARVEELKSVAATDAAAPALPANQPSVLPEMPPIAAVSTADGAEDSMVEAEVESLDKTAQAARNRAIVKGTEVELDGRLYDLSDPRDALRLCQLGVISLNRQQIDSAKALLPFFHGKVADQGKKGAQEEAARKAVGGRFSTLPTPSPQGALFQR